MARKTSGTEVTGPYPHGGPLRSSDAFAWRMEGDPLLRSTVVSVLVLDQMPEWSALAARVEHLTRVVPVLRERIRTDLLGLGSPRFTAVPDLDLGHHLRRVGAPDPGGLRTLLELARVDGEEAFDPARPLWRITLVEGVHVDPAAPGEPAGRAALVIKLHHSLADGLGALQIAVHLFDADRQPAGEPEADPRLRRPVLTLPTVVSDVIEDTEDAARTLLAIPRVVTQATWSSIRHPGRTLATAASVARFVAPVNRTLSPVMTRRRLGWRYGALNVALRDLRGAARAGGGTVNDAFLAAVTGGLDRYQGRHGNRPPELRVTLPVSLRRDGDEEGGNRLTLIRFPVPVRDPDPASRMREIGKRVRAWRREPALGLAEPIAAALNVLPRRYLGSLLKHVDFLASNVAGFPTPIYLAGARVLRQYPFGPTIGAALNVTLMSYCDRCWIGVTTDTGAIPDHDALLECLRESFQEVCALASGEQCPTPAWDAAK